LDQDAVFQTSLGAACVVGYENANFTGVSVRTL